MAEMETSKMSRLLRAAAGKDPGPDPDKAGVDPEFLAESRRFWGAMAEMRDKSAAKEAAKSPPPPHDGLPRATPPAPFDGNRVMNKLLREASGRQA